MYLCEVVSVLPSLASVCFHWRISKAFTVVGLLCLGFGGLALPAPASADAGKVLANPEIIAAKTLVDKKKFYDAFGKLAELVPTLTPDDPGKPIAQFLLAKTLYELGLYQSALRGLDAVAVGPDDPLLREKLHQYLLIQRAVPGDLATIERLSDAAESMHKAEDVDEIRFLLAQYYYNIGDQDKAIARLQPVKPDAGETYLKARHLLGVIYVVKNLAQPALEAFKDVLRFEEQVGNPSYYAEYRDLANMSLGRLFYSIRQYETAGRYYDHVTEHTTAWLDSLFELGWTYFQMGRIDRVLGELHTLNSPYFEDRYYPEARVLESLILFRTCRFAETLVSVERFLRDYKPLKKELDAQLAGQRTDAEFYDYLFTLSANQKTLSVPLRRIFNVALKDKRLQRAFASVVLANDEMAGLDKLIRNTSATKPAEELKADMGRVRAVMISEAGGLARRRLQRVREDLTEIIRQGLRIKYETMKARRGSISESVRIDMEETAKAVSEPREEDSEHVVWPFDGSYWKDELGGYTYDTRSKCTAAQMRHSPVKSTPKDAKADDKGSKSGDNAAKPANSTKPADKDAKDLKPAVDGKGASAGEGK